MSEEIPTTRGIGMLEKGCIAAIKGQLMLDGFDLSNAPMTIKLVEAIVNNILAEVRNAKVTVPSVGFIAPAGVAGGPVTGVSSTGSIS